MSAKRFFNIDAFVWTLLLISHSLLSVLPGNDATPWKERGIAAAYLVASKLTDPLSHAHKLYRKTLIVDILYPESTESEKWLRKGALMLEAGASSFVSLFTTLPGIELRFVAQCLQHKPYLYFKGSAENILVDKPLSILSWNVCCISGGYAITDGGVLPWPERIDKLTEAVAASQADVVCLYEIFDIQTALHLFKKLQNLYGHFYFNIGPNAVGLSSGLCILSKIPISDPEFSPFPSERFHGRGKFCKKGFFSFDVEKQKRVRIYATHLQHSEIPETPNSEEIAAREHAMGQIVRHMQKFADKVCVLTGDLNLEEKEYYASAWHKFFEKGIVTGEGYTWGGDGFCSALVDKPISGPLNLDHTVVSKNAGAKLTTTYLDSRFDGESFSLDAISDHKGLLSVIIVD